MISVRTRIEAQRAIAALEKFDQAIDRNVLLGAVGQSLLGWVMKNFRDQGTETRWPALSPNTIVGRRAGRIKNSQGAMRFRGRRVVGSAGSLSGAKALQDTGRLRQSFTSKVTGDAVEVGTQMKIAEYHQYGTGPYTIKPRQAKKLFFMTAGGPRFAKIVRHPGIPKRPLIPSDTMAERIGIIAIDAELKRAYAAANRDTA